MKLLEFMGVMYMLILWADVGERLGVDKTELRELRTTFGDVLGLDASKTVCEGIVPVLERVKSLRLQGVSDEEIRNAVGRLPKDGQWPEEVLTRMEQVTPVTQTFRGEDAKPEADAAAGIIEAQQSQSVKPSATATPSDLSEQTLREIVFSLRREIGVNACSERDLVFRLMQHVQKLALEVRDLRYAFLLASSRKDRKKGIKAISRLLSG